jgi:photosystem II stability/assembly factor-like uncharacterized protein
MDGGATFQKVTAAGLPRLGGRFTFDPHNPSFVYTTAGNLGVFRSTNDGDTFERLGLTAKQVGEWASAFQVSVDPSNPDVIYVNTDRGNFKSVNGGKTFRSINAGWNAAQVNHITFDNASDPSLYVSMNNGSGILRTRTRGKHYEEVPNTAGGYAPTVMAVAPTNPDMILAGTAGGGLLRTTDGGRSWSRASVDNGLIDFSTQWSEIAIDPLDPNHVYFVSYTIPFELSGFYRSTDGGVSFQRTEALPGYPSLRRVAIDPLRPNVIYAASANIQGPLRSLDGGLSFEIIGIPEAFIEDIAVDPIDSNNVYLAGGFRFAPESPPHYVLRSTDGGSTYAALDPGLSAFPLGLVIDPERPNRLYAWTREGLYMTSDSGTTWTLLEGDETIEAIHPWGANSIAIHPKKSNLLYLASGATVLEVEVRN